MPLSKEDAHNLREDDVILVPMRVVRSNNHFDSNGVSLSVVGPFFDTRLFSEQREKPLEPLRIGSNLVHAVKWRPLRVGDRVQFQHHVYPDCKGRIAFIDEDTKEATVRFEDAVKGGPQSLVKPLNDLERILTPADRERYDLDKT
ncbi:hypothetical protein PAPPERLAPAPP_04140 [Brevundimonas phage vB_BpoS-Papperlapapp]|uniref:Uncharacterized protein n=1 Tax=Brevundimonas phage vB_BpoS-Domovoi TaxID=2948598 RepID=A0A9E7SJS9_9CAUD|nr:hypothetical protein DOMOVOI_03090 [Brevundimonas phage vB_BpoS-Domovoi]USN16155.1 hypothetical protein PAPPERLAPAPP_04140 [Brevundimonas phage vB_BpoS-Papperlapapp]